MPSRRLLFAAPVAPLFFPARRAAAAISAPVALEVPYLRQEPNLCVPISAAMILAFYGDPQPPRRLKRLAMGKPYDPKAPFSDFSITLYRDLIKGMGRVGYAWAERTYPDTPAGAAAGLRDIEAELRAGRPVMVDVSLPGIGHTFVVRGFDPFRRTLLIVDPSAPAPGRRTLGYDAFARVWNEHAYGGRFRALIVTRRKPGVG